MNKTILVFLAFMLVACAKPIQQGDDPTSSAAVTRWQEFLRLEANQQPYRLNLSMRFGDQSETRRVTAIFWGESAQKNFRMDVMAGVGVTIAQLYEDANHFLIYIPRDNRAFFHQGEEKPLLKIGVPIPFNIHDLANLLLGNFSDVFGKNGKPHARPAEGRTTYLLEGKPGGELCLDFLSRPVQWKETGADKWIMDIVYEDGDGHRPKRISLKNENGKQAIVIVKSREDVQGFEPSQMQVKIPDNTPLLPLSRYKSKH